MAALLVSLAACGGAGEPDDAAGSGRAMLASTTINADATSLSAASGATASLTAPTGSATEQLAPAATTADGAAPASTTATPAVTSVGGTSTILVKARSTIVGGVGSIIQVRVNGAVAGSAEVRAAAFADLAFAVPAVARGSTVDVVFTNDAVVAGVDRNLWVSAITVDGALFPASSSMVIYDRGVGAAAFDGVNVLTGQEGLFWAGALRFALPVASPGYYVDQVSGSDSNPGTIERPWQTLSKISSIQLKTGEGIYLRCGGVWRESLSLDWFQLADGATIAGYGSNCSSVKATITGAMSLRSGWTKNGNIWSRAVPAGTPKITRLYVDDSAHRVARWPNFTNFASDYALSDLGSPISSTVLRAASADRAQLQGQDLTGATAQVRSAPWQVDTRTVASYAADGTLTLSAATTSTMQPGNGYVLQGKLWMLDAPGEFVHDNVANRVYVYPAASAQQSNLNAFAVEGSVRSSVLQLSGRPRLTVRDLAVTMSSGEGLKVTDAPGTQITGVVATRNIGGGITLGIFDRTVTSTLRSAVSNSVVSENWMFGINGTYMPRLDVVNNTVLDTGTGDNAGWSVAAISVGDAGNVTGNTVLNSAHHGIRFSGGAGSLVKNNHVGGYCVRVSDCGGIYTWNGPKGSQRTVNQSSIVEGNQILEASANMRGAVGGGADVVAGIYLDDFTLGSTVRGNSIAGAPMGIFLHNSSSNTVTQNSIWLTSKVGLWASMDQTDADYMTGNVFSDNELVRIVRANGTYPALPSISASNAVWFWHKVLGTSSLSAGSNVFTGNRHIEVNGVTIAAALVRSGTGEQYLSAAAWRALNPAEGALRTPMTFATNAPITGPEIIPDGTFSAGQASWTTWLGSATPRGSVQWPTAASGCSGTCARLTSSTRGDMLYSTPFSMTPGIPYLVGYSIGFGGAATVSLPYISRTVSPWDSLTDSSGYISTSSRSGVAGTTSRYEAFFRATTSAPARLNLQLETLGVPVAFDNVSVKAVTGFSFATPAEWARVVHAPRTGNLSVDCSQLGWGSGCAVIDSNANPVQLPVQVAAGTSRIFFRADSTWRR